MKIEFINAAFEQVPSKAPGGRSYGKALVTYKAGGKTMTQNVMSFANPEVYRLLQEVSQGDILEVTITKNAGGYNQWSSVERSTGAPDTSPAPVSTSAPAKTGTTAYAARDFENKEERAQRQALIVRQSSLSNAITILTTVAKAPPKLEDVFTTANELVKFVYNVEPEIPNETGFDDIPNEI